MHTFTKSFEQSYFKSVSLTNDITIIKSYIQPVVATFCTPFFQPDMFPISLSNDRSI